MSKITVNELPTLTNSNFTGGDYFLVWDESSGQSCKFSVEQYGNDIAARGLLGGNYHGVVDASVLNSSPLAGAAENGDWHFVSVAGTIEGLTVDVHDIIKYNGTIWERVPRGIAVAANSRQTLLSTQTAIAADGEQPVVDPTGLPGWYYKNTAGNKINWYFYGDTNFTNNTYDDFAGMYAIVELKAGYLYFQVYTKPTGSGDASWYKSRINWDDDSGTIMQVATPGRYVVHTAGMDVSAVEPGTPRLELPISTSFSVGTQGAGEEIWLMALSTSSSFAEGHNEFTVEQFAYRFGEQTHAMDLVGVKPDPVLAESDPLFNASFKGNFANEAALPAATDGQWAINNETDTIWIYDGGTTSWVESAGTPPQPVADVPYVYSYGDDGGTQTGYGWMNADTSVWEALSNGNLQANGGSSRPVDATVKFATLKSDGDSVSINNVNLNNFGGTYYRAAFFYAQGGYVVPWSTHFYNDVGSGESYYVEGTADLNNVFGHNCYVRPYFGASSYAGGMNGIVGNNYTPADLSSVDLTWRLVDIGGGDIRLEFLVDNVIVSRSKRSLVGGFATNGIDLYVLAKKYQVWPQPSGAAPNDPNPVVGDAWPGPVVGRSFDGVNDKIVLPSLEAAYRPYDASAFAVTGSFIPVANQWNSLYQTGDVVFSMKNFSTNLYYSQWCSPHSNLAVGQSTVYGDQSLAPVWRDNRINVTMQWAGKDNSECQALRNGTTFYYHPGWRGTYNTATRIFTPDPTGPKVYIAQEYYYSGGFWALMQNADGTWTRALFNNRQTMFGGLPANYNQTIINTPTTNKGPGAVAVPNPSSGTGWEPANSWSIYIDGVWTHGQGVTDNMESVYEADPMHIGLHIDSAGGLHYSGMQGLSEYAVHDMLSADEVASLHTLVRVQDLRTWATDSGKTLRLYYPTLDSSDIADFSGNGNNATWSG
jgi:hypothetical protein